MNQKDPELVERFIALRAQGWPLARIAAELNVCKKTLINWSRQFAQRIQNERALEEELDAEKLKLSRRACLSHISQLHERLVEELRGRPLEEVPTHRPLQMAMDLRKEAQAGRDRLTLSTYFTEKDVASGNLPKPVISWEI